MMQYLGLEDIQEVPFGYEKYVWLSERYSKSIAWSKEHQVNFSVIPENWETDEEIEDAGYYLEQVKEIVMSYAADLLNEYHHTAFDIDEWNIMLSEWMMAYLFTFYYKYLKLLQVEATEQNYECDLYEIETDVIALDYTEYHELARTENFCLYQYSELYQEHLHVDNIKIRQLKKYKKPLISYRDKTWGYYKILAYRIFLKGIKALTQMKDKVVFQDSYLPFDFLSNVMKKKPGRITNYVTDYHRFERKKLDTKIDYVWRNTASQSPEIEDEFAALMCKLLKKNLPIAYVEGFKFLRKRAGQLYKFAQEPNAVFFADCGVCSDEIFKAYLMSIRRTNVLFCDIQHGGNYGIENLLTMRSEYKLCDYFYTWGWKISGLPCKCRPMPAAKLLDSRLQHVKMGTNILYVSYSFFQRDSALYKRSLFYNRERLDEIEFLKELSKPLKEKMLVRLFQDDHGWHVKEEIDRQVSGIRYDEENDFYLSLRNAKLVVLMVWSTTILEALYAGKPILVLHDKCCMEREALEDIQDLERVGILVWNWKDLGTRLEEIYQDVDKWWNDPERQRVVQKIREKYIYMPSNAKEVWTDEIFRLAERD